MSQRWSAIFCATGALGLINFSKFLSLIEEANCSEFILNYEEWMFNGTEMTRISASVDATLSDLGEELSSCDSLSEKMITLSIWMIILSRDSSPDRNLTTLAQT